MDKLSVYRADRNSGGNTCFIDSSLNYIGASPTEQFYMKVSNLNVYWDWVGNVGIKEFS
jgi:hypothetical protein